MVNLDNMDDDELKQAMAILIKLHTYANLRRFTIQYRLSGEIELARQYEERMDKIYNELPQEYRW